MDWVEALSRFEEIEVHPNDCWHEWWDTCAETPRQILQRCDEFLQTLRLMRDEVAIVVCPPRLLRHLFMEHAGAEDEEDEEDDDEEGPGTDEDEQEQKKDDDDDDDDDTNDGSAVENKDSKAAEVAGGTGGARKSGKDPLVAARIAELIHALKTHNEIPRSGVLCADFDFRKGFKS